MLNYIKLSKHSTYDAGYTLDHTVVGESNLAKPSKQ